MRRLSPLVLVLVILTLVGCAGLPFSRPDPIGVDLTQAPGVGNTPSAGVTQSPVVPIVPQQTPAIPTPLTIWVPPQFDPDSGSPAGKLLKDRLEEFASKQDGLEISIRIKATSGPASLLESLAAAKAAAPGALPDLVALPRSDMEIAALKGLLVPYDGLTSIPDDPDWYEYSRQLMLLQGSAFGLPFAGDALVMLYRPDQINPVPSDWTSLLNLAGPLAFPAADPQALFSLSYYQSEGGLIQDIQGRPTLESEKLAKVLQYFLDGVNRGLLPYWMTQYETDTQIWQAYQDQRAPMVVTWISRYLQDLPPDTGAAMLPAGDTPSLSLANGWVWAIPQPEPQRQERSAQLAEFLVDSGFLAEWGQAAGYLPTRPSSLAVWSNQPVQPLVSQVVLSARARPTNDILVSIGPLLRDATNLILKGQSDPVQVAQDVVNRLNNP